MRQKQHNYMKKIAKMKKRGELPTNAGLHHVYIYHDSWCAIYDGKMCNCDPIVKVRK